MIRVKMLKNQEVCVIDEGKTYLFNSSGICTTEDAGLIPQYTNGMVELPILSILSCNGENEILAFISDTMSKHYKTSLDASTIAMTLLKNRGFVRMLRRDGKQGENSFNQLLFIYPEHTDLTPYLRALNAKEVHQNMSKVLQMATNYFS